MDAQYVLTAAVLPRSAQHAQPLTEETCLDYVRKHNGITWVHVTAKDKDETALMLVERFGLHPLEVEDALSSLERPHLQEREGSLFLSLPEAVVEGEAVRYVEVGFFILDHLLVTACASPSPTMELWMERWQKHNGKHVHDASFLLHLLLDAIVDGYYPVTDDFEDRIDELEDEIFKGGRKGLEEILLTKRRLLEFRRQVAPARDIMNGLLRRDIPLIRPEVLPFFQDVFDHTLRVLETIDMNRDVIASLLDGHVAIVGNRLNDIMRVLTVLSTFLMTGALIAGIYGMNFEHLPEVKWVYGYPFAYCLMIGLCVLEFWYFKRKKFL